MLRLVGAGLRELAFPAECAGCGRAGVVLCLTCTPRRPPIRTTAADGLCVSAAADYDGGLRAALLAYKERGRRDLAAPLGALLGRATADLDGVLIPVPSAPEAVRRRGGDHVRRLALTAARATDRSVEAAVELRRTVRDSAGLGIAARRANLAGAFTARPPIRPGDRAVLVDDIITTGATLAEAARALSCAGWSLAGAAVVAATPRRPTADPLVAPR